MADTLNPEVRAFLNDTRFAVLATVNASGAPQQSVVWYELRGNEVMMNTRRGRVKDRNLRRDARASICVDDGYRYVTLRGHVVINDDPAQALADIRALAVRYHGEETADRQMAEQFSKEPRATVTLSVEGVSAYGF